MRITLLFLFISQLLFAQDAVIELKIDSITVSDSIDYERKYTIQYHIENKTDKTISFLYMNKDRLSLNRRSFVTWHMTLTLKRKVPQKKRISFTVDKVLQFVMNSLGIYFTFFIAHIF